MVLMAVVPAGSCSAPGGGGSNSELAAVRPAGQSAGVGHLAPRDRGGARRHGYRRRQAGQGSRRARMGVPAMSSGSVADASILPEIPSASTNIPVIMVAEHVAAHRARQRAARPAMAGAS